MQTTTERRNNDHAKNNLSSGNLFCGNDINVIRELCCASNVNLDDVIMVILSVVLGAVFLDGLKGFGVATIISAIFVGRTLALMKKHISFGI